MPVGSPVSSYDILCPFPGQTWASRALRKIIVPVSDVVLTDPRVEALRGVVLRAPSQGGLEAPNPISGNRKTGCLDEFTGAELGQPTSVFSLYIQKLLNIDNVAQPPPVIFQIRSGTGGVTTVRYTGVVSANTWEYRDLWIQLSGLLGTQWEILARVATDAVPAAGRVEMLLTCCLDIHDDKFDRATLGPNVAAGGP